MEEQGQSSNPSGGSGGGGRGARYNGPAAQNGSGNTGGGGGGGRDGVSAKSGGSGVVFVSMPTGNYSGTQSGASSVSTSGGYTILRFNGSGSVAK